METGIHTHTGTRTVTDSYGNQVVIPAEVTRVAPTIPAFIPLTELLTQGGGNIVASTHGVTSNLIAIFPDYTKANPYHYNVRHVPDLIAAKAQVVYGPEDRHSDDYKAQLREAGIAFVALNNVHTFAGMCETILTIGEILGEHALQMAEKFVAYYRHNMDDAARRTAGLSAGDKKRIAQIWSMDWNGQRVYTCINKDNIAHAYYEAAGAINVAADYCGDRTFMNHDCSAEQIIAWNPAYIITMDSNREYGGVRELLLSDPALADVDAVQHGNVFTCPTKLHLWNARSSEGAMMPYWTGTILYPELFGDIDMQEVVRNFYRQFYNTEVNDEWIHAVLAGK